MAAYLECSAKTGEGVNLAMEKVTRLALRAKLEKEIEKKSSRRRRFF
jgi:hypothetical protein